MKFLIDNALSPVLATLLQQAVYLAAAADATTPGEGRAGVGWSFDTFAISAGRNNTLEVDFEATPTKGTSFATGGSVGNDDLLYVVSGYGK